MKQKLLINCSTLLILVLFTAFIYASGKPIEGVITYKISILDSKFTESQLAMFPNLMTISFKGTKSKTKMISSMGTQTEIKDYSEKTKSTLLDMMGQKYAIKETSADLQKEMDKEPRPIVEITNEIKTIVGYTCKKAIVLTDLDGEKTVNEVWFTNELGSKEINFNDLLYKDIDGMLMEYSVKTSQFTMKFTVTTVEKKSLSAEEFDIPADYKLTTKEELKSKFGGM
jgi:GLPGLI family protein